MTGSEARKRKRVFVDKGRVGMRARLCVTDAEYVGWKYSSGFVLCWMICLIGRRRNEEMKRWMDWMRKKK